jgi:hypothetical protein
MLNDVRRWKALIALASVLAAIGISRSVVGGLGVVGIAASMTPLCQLLLFRFEYSLFVSHYGREPIDVAMVWQRGLASDRWFSISYYLLAIFLPAAIIGSQIWGTAR